MLFIGASLDLMFHDVRGKRSGIDFWCVYTGTTSSRNKLCLLKWMFVVKEAQFVDDSNHCLEQG